MPDLRILRQLDVSSTPGDASVRHLSAASGLVRAGSILYVVADDEHCLGVFDLNDTQPGRLVRLFDADLPPGQQERKAAKPDLESLTVLPAFEGHPHGALLAAGSGSKPNRQRGVLVGLDADGALDGTVREFDLAPMYEPLRGRFPELNIEGAFIAGQDLCLLQRGHRRSPVNACARFAWPGVERWLRGDGPAPTARSITSFELGALGGVPLCFTDGAALASGAWVFCAAAEDTDDSYADGHCAGSVVGLVDATGEVLWQAPLPMACKAEGIALAAPGERLELLLVTDADDRSTPAQLLSMTRP